MRRLLLSLLIYLLPLQSFAGLVMSAKMTPLAPASASSHTAMATTMSTSEAPCHETSQVDTPASHDSCGLQSLCQTLCQLNVGLPPAGLFTTPHLQRYVMHSSPAQFSSTDLAIGFKPPKI